MSNEKNTNTNVEKKDATVVAHEIKGELTSEDTISLISEYKAGTFFWYSTLT
ncbi:general stress protein 24 [Streptococcus pneumoniae]|nr:general stress protein 24 [Streptococcus pneumoniae]